MYVASVVSDNFKFHGSTCPAKPESVEPIEIGGEPGALIAWNCGILINVAATVHGGTGYHFVFRDPAVAAGLAITSGLAGGAAVPLAYAALLALSLGVGKLLVSRQT